MPDRRIPEVDVMPVDDVLGRHTSLPHVREMRVLGIAVVCQSNSRYVCDRFAEVFAICQHDASAPTDAPPLTVQVMIVPWPDHGSTSPPIRAFALDATRLVLHSPGSIAAIDPERREAVAFASAAFAADRIAFARHLLEAMTLALLTHHDRHPLHASAITKGARAVLLTGPSGTGKSTLAHVAHAAGLNVLSEDTVWIQQHPEFQVWGLPRAVYLRDGAGPDKLAVPLTGTAAAAICSAPTARVCLLERGHHSARMERLDADAIGRALSQDVAAGFDRYPERHLAVVRRLAAPGGWKLQLTDDATAALPFLRQMLNAETP
jgi:hypothetical protein